MFTAARSDADAIEDNTTNVLASNSTENGKHSSLVNETTGQPQKKSVLMNNKRTNENLQSSHTSCQIPLHLCTKTIQPQETSTLAIETMYSPHISRQIFKSSGNFSKRTARSPGTSTTLTNENLQSPSILSQIESDLPKRTVPPQERSTILTNENVHPPCTSWEIPLDLPERTVHPKETSIILTNDNLQSPSTLCQIPLDLSKGTIQPQETSIILTNENYQSPSSSGQISEHPPDLSSIKQEEDYCCEDETNVLPNIESVNMEDIKEEYEEVIIVTSEQNGDSPFINEENDVVRNFVLLIHYFSSGNINELN